MKFSSAFVAAAIASLVAAAPSPAAPSSSQALEVFERLDSQGAIKWTPSGDGKVATLTPEQISAGIASLSSSGSDKITVKWPVFDGLSFAKHHLKGVSLDSLCVKDGAATVPVEIIKKQATKGCKGLLGGIPGSGAVDGAYKFYQETVNGDILNFFHSRKEGTALTEKICNEAINALNAQYCDHIGKGETKGGEVIITEPQNGALGFFSRLK